MTVDEQTLNLVDLPLKVYIHWSISMSTILDDHPPERTYFGLSRAQRKIKLRVPTLKIVQTVLSQFPKQPLLIARCSHFCFFGNP